MALQKIVDLVAVEAQECYGVSEERAKRVVVDRASRWTADGQWKMVPPPRIPSHLLLCIVSRVP